MNLSKHWQGSIRIDDSTTVNGIELHCPPDSQNAISPKAPFRFLSLVDIHRIPLHLMTGPGFAVSSYDNATEAWFSRHLLASHAATSYKTWWETARPDSPLGILVAVGSLNAPTTKSVPRITELLFYATRTQLLPGDELDKNATNGTPSISVRAIGLSSDLYRARPEPTPPSSPTAPEDDVEAIFLPPQAPPQTEIVYEPPVRKRKTATDAFDEAAERKKKARRHGGESVAAAAALKREDALPTLNKHRRSISSSTVPPIRPLSRSPRIASTSRPGTARTPSEAPKRSSLLHVQNAPDAGSAAQDPSSSPTETKNKDLISRLVMAGMRLHGLLSHSKSSRKSRSHPNNDMPAAAAAAAVETSEAEKEYKLMYHQVYKGTCFAFRRSMATVSLSAHTDAVRETVEKLLALFCKDP
ncbi:hypothetical protein EJ03DRAFT_372060, partial [Teratosphaeria nubilosa]